MYIVSGATGHIGSVVASTLLEHKLPVTVIIHNPEKSGYWHRLGATVAVLDVLETEQLRSVLQSGKRLFLLNPPAPPNTDTVTLELKTVASFLEALKDSGIEKVVGESTYGAQPGKGLGDLGVLYEMEQGLKAQGIPNSIIRGAYYMSNWDIALASASEKGQISTLYPADFKMPMVAPEDIGKIAARLLMAPVEDTGLHYVEGPQPYSAADVAAAFSTALNKPVKVVTTPKDQWQTTLENGGFSTTAAASMVAMTDITLREGYEKPDTPERGATTLQEYITALVTKEKDK